MIMNTENQTVGLSALLGVTLAFTTFAAEPASARGSSGTDAEIRALRAELARTRAETQAEIQALREELANSREEKRADVKASEEKIEAKQQELEHRIAHQEEHQEEHHNLIFFRGGYAALSHARDNELFINNPNIANTPGDNKENGDGGYVGAGFDFRLSDDVWGLWEGANVDGELMFEYKDYGTTSNEFVNYATQQQLTIENQVSQFTLTASPKIKFTQLGDFRPWIIPFGLGLHVISPPSSGVTYLNPGLMVGAGAEYKLWKDLYAGLDFRYHWTGGDLNYKSTVNGVTVLNKTVLDGFTTGAYLGFGF